ncbi:hypothetical protein [Paraburkholderia dinghuensis]|uniref:Uncharacterized protein n=1 Tax=Paraburkholderia dinghuensis TaxID=2305225 RepID=A0A3N6MMD1_9BURK|nr:hypothetical protein [Paraburkholderia dinghuensis]RQH04994.1 hypothetical protein D1Y85_16415 [Paraburkholderia dinghuensis]
MSSPTRVIALMHVPVQRKKWMIEGMRSASATNTLGDINQVRMPGIDAALDMLHHHSMAVVRRSFERLETDH